MEVILREHVDNLGRRGEIVKVADGYARNFLLQRERLANIEVVIARKVGETEALYGSVTTADIAEALAAKGFEIDRRKLQLAEPIKKIGDVEIPVKLHRDVVAQLKVRVVPEGTA